MITTIETETTKEKRNLGGTLVLEGTKHFEMRKYFLGIRIRKRVEHATIECEEIVPHQPRTGFKK